MKIKSRKNRIILIAVVLLVLVIGGAATYALTEPLREGETSSKSSNINEDSTSTSEDGSSTNDTDKTTTNTDQPAPIVVDGESGKNIVQLVSSYDISNGTLYIRGGINNSVVYDGICFANLTGPSGQIIKKETTLLQNASTTDCKTISVNTDELVSGRWTYTLNYTSDNMEGHSSAAAFEIK